MDKCVQYYSHTDFLLPPKPKSSFRHLMQGIQEFHCMFWFQLTSPQTTLSNVCRLHYINTVKQELNGTKAYEETSTDDKTVVNSHSNELPYNFAVNVKKRHDKLPTVYW